VTTEKTVPIRNWRTINQTAEQYEDVYTPPALRALVQRAKPHFNAKGEWVEGNGLASAICQPGGKNGKIMIDEIAFAIWLEQWVGAGETCNQKVVASNRRLAASNEAGCAFSEVRPAVTATPATNASRPPGRRP
jgi:hypothetical protein